MKARTQAGLAVSADGVHWILINASPDLRAQIMATSALHPRGKGRHSPIQGVVVTNGEVDHIAGLLTLRERQRLALFGTAAVLDLIRSNAIFAVLDAHLVEPRRMAFDVPTQLAEGLEAIAFAVPGKPPLYVENEGEEIGKQTDRVIGLELQAGATRFVYIPNCAHVTPEIRSRADGADLLMFDGTTFTNDEMTKLGLSQRTASRMGHVAMSGPSGSLASLAGVAARRKVFVHINNTNPVLIEDSAERRAVENGGWEIAHDGMEYSM